MTTPNPADYPIGAILRDPKTSRLAVRRQVDDASGRGMHAWYVPVPNGEARILHHNEVYGWQLVVVPVGVADVVRAVLERQAVEVQRLTGLAEANGRNARFWADHFAEVDKANRDALGAHHKPGHSVAELITALACRPAIPADAEAYRAAAELALLDMVGGNGKPRITSAALRSSAANAVVDELVRRNFLAPVSGSDTTEAGAS